MHTDITMSVSVAGFSSIDENQCSIYQVGPNCGKYGYAPVVNDEKGHVILVDGSEGFVFEAMEESLAAWRIEGVLDKNQLIVVHTRYGRVILRKWSPSATVDSNRIAVVQMRPVFTTCLINRPHPDTTNDELRIEVLGSAAIITGRDSGVLNWEHKILKELETRMSGLWFMHESLHLGN